MANESLALYHDVNGRPAQTRIGKPRRRLESNVDRDFVEAIREGRAPVTTAEEAVLISKVVDAIYASSEQNREVAL